MRLSFSAIWPLAASFMASVATAADSPSSGIVEVDLMFPRNETYAPGEHLTVMFAVQNTALAGLVGIDISFNLYNQDDYHNSSLYNPHSIVSGSRRMKWDNLTASSPDPFFFDYYFNQAMELHATEGRFTLEWTVYWAGCADDSFTPARPGAKSSFISSHTTHSLDFALKNGSQPMDPIAATAADKPCPAELGAALNVTTKTVAVPAAFTSGWTWDGNAACAVLPSDTAKPTPSPCRVKVDEAAVSSLAASREAEMCSARPGGCAAQSSSAAAGAARPLGVAPFAVAGTAGMAVVVGVLGFFVMWV